MSTAKSEIVGVDLALHFTLATAGHVDHGKTSLLRALTGIDPDRLKEEKEREMTIDLGFANFRVSGSEIEALDKGLMEPFHRLLGGSEGELVVGFVDVPGHGKFLKNMLAGVGGIDMALLVVAADEGVMPQTIQHGKILSLLGIKECILVLNKIDLADEETKDIALMEAQELLALLHIDVLETIFVSSVNHSGIADLRRSIIKHVLHLPRPERLHDALSREMPSFLAIDRVFSKAGYGAVVTGTLTRGSIKVGDEVFIIPGENSARVRGLQTFSRKLDKAFPGQRLAINLALKENKPIERGQAVVGRQVNPTRSLIVQLTDLGGIETLKNFGKLALKEHDTASEEPLKPQAVRFYHGTAERYGHLRWCQRLQADGVQKTSPEVFGQLFLDEPVIAFPGERFVIRYGDFGIAGGEILMTARPRWLTRLMLAELAALVMNGKINEAASELINLSPQRSLDETLLSAILPQQTSSKVIESLLAKGDVEKIGDQFITRGEREELVRKVLAELEQVAAKGERDPSVSQEKLRVMVAPLVNRAVFQNIIKDLLSSNRVVKIDEKLALTTQVKPATEGGELSPLMDEILSVLEEEFCIEIATLIERTRSNKKDLTDALHALEKSNRAAIINYEFAAGRPAILKSHKVLADLWQRHRNIAPGDFREQVGTSRKYAMALLAYFDDHQITRRLNNGRVLLKMPPA